MTFKPVRSIALPVIASAVLIAPPAEAQQAADTITVAGTAQVAPKPLNRNSNASIAKAVKRARTAATPLALANGQARATELASLAGLKVGRLLAITEGFGAAPFGVYAFGQDGTFGNGQYCGTVRRSRVVTKNGKKQRVVTSSRICRVPQQVIATLTLTYSTGPA